MADFAGGAWVCQTGFLSLLLLLLEEEEDEEEEEDDEDELDFLDFPIFV